MKDNDIEINVDSLVEDIAQYNEVLDMYKQLETEDIELAYDISKECLLLANRWNEIMLNSAKFCIVIETNKTTFEKWAYHKYRVLMTAHEFCRVVWRQGKEEYKNSFNNEL